MTTIPRVSGPSSNYLLTYDAWNRVVAIKTGSGSPVPIGDYSYDGLHRRISRVRYDSGGSEIFTRRMYYSTQWQVLEERQLESMDWKLNKQYVWGTRYVDELILRDNDLSNPPDGTLDYRHYALQDANFNVVAIVNNVGDVGRRFDYDAYGHSSTLNADFTPGAYEYDFEYRYAGYRWDYETHLLQVRNRWYHPRLGRFVSRDPIGYDGGSLNLYEYLTGSPLRGVDPLGLQGTTPNGPFGEPLPKGFDEWFGNPEGGCKTVTFAAFALWYQRAGGKMPRITYTAIREGGCIGLASAASVCPRNNMYPFRVIEDGVVVDEVPNFPVPEQLSSVKCFRTEREARARKCRIGKNNFVFAKQGKWKGGKAPSPGNDGSIPTDSIVGVRGDGDFDYITVSGGYYWNMNHGTLGADGSPVKPSWHWDPVTKQYLYDGTWNPPFNPARPQEITICKKAHPQHERLRDRMWCSRCRECK
jgi:RHS repeat-associated protein